MCYNLLLFPKSNGYFTGVADRFFRGRRSPSASVVIDFGKRYLTHTVAGMCGPFKTLLAQRSLVRLLLRRDIKLRTSGTILGGLWMILQPALQVAALWFLLDVILHIKFPGMVSFLDYFLIGMVPWLMMSEIMVRNLSVLNEFSALYQRAVFPVAVLPMLPALVSGLVYGVIYFVLVLILQGSGAAVRSVLVILGLLIWLVPIGYLLAVLGLFIKDAGNSVGFILTMTMYLTPIIYMPEMLPEFARQLLVLNPFADVMAIIHGVLQGMPFEIGNVLRPMLLWVLLLAPAWVLFCRSEPHMREEL